MWGGGCPLALGPIGGVGVQPSVRQEEDSTAEIILGAGVFLGPGVEAAFLPNGEWQWGCCGNSHWGVSQRDVSHATLTS